MPTDSPNKKKISTNHLFSGQPFGSCSYLMIHQNTSAEKSDEVAYTSASTAENQKLSVKA